MAATEHSPTRLLARFASELRYEELPPAVVDMARRCLTDWLGVAIAGSRQPLSPILRTVVEQLGGNPQATIVGLGTRTSAAHAAMVNGSLAHSIDYDDVHQRSGVHASAPVWAATLAVAEWRGASAREATAAFVAGYEAMSRLGLAVVSPLSTVGFHGTATFGYYGGAAAAGRLLGLSEEAMAGAFGIASGQAGGLSMVRGTMSKPFLAGHSAHGGVLSALMASNGFVSVTNAIEGPEGVLAVYPRSPLAEEVFRDLGDRYELLNTSVKIHACCSVTHGMIDGLLEIRNEPGFEPSRVEDIRVGLHLHGTKYVNRPEVTSGLAGKFSGQFCAAVALLDGQAGESRFTDERVRDPEVRRLMERVRFVPVEGILPSQADLEVRMADGRTHRRRIETVKGGPARPVSWSDLAGKFEGLAQTALPQSRIAELLDRLAAWPDTEVGELLRLTAA